MTKVIEDIHRRSVEEERGGEKVPWARNLVALARQMKEVILAPLTNPKVCEIMLNPNGKLYVEELGNPDSLNEPYAYIKPSVGEAIIRAVARVI